MMFLFCSIRLERIEHERPRASHALQAPEYRDFAHNLAGARTSSGRGLPRPEEVRAPARHHLWWFPRLPALYTGTKELSYPPCRRSALDSQAQRCVLKLPTLTQEARHMPTPGQPTS